MNLTSTEDVVEVGLSHYTRCLIPAVLEQIRALRDTHLPKLISGELRVPDAEKLLDDSNINRG